MSNCLKFCNSVTTSVFCKVYGLKLTFMALISTLVLRRLFEPITYAVLFVDSREFLLCVYVSGFVVNERICYSFNERFIVEYNFNCAISQSSFTLKYFILLRELFKMEFKRYLELDLNLLRN